MKANTIILYSTIQTISLCSVNNLKKIKNNNVKYIYSHSPLLLQSPSKFFNLLLQFILCRLWSSGLFCCLLIHIKKLKKSRRRRKKSIRLVLTCKTSQITIFSFRSFLLANLPLHTHWVARAAFFI